jgi:DNA-binding LytR/AlgR family response regulator
MAVLMELCRDDQCSQCIKAICVLTSSNDRQIFERAKLTVHLVFLMKPFNELEILYAIEMAVEKFHNQNDAFFSDEQDTVISAEYVLYKKGKSLKKKCVDIIYIEVEERYCNIITEKKKFVIMMSLTKMLELLDSSRFSRTHRNYVVNGKIEEIIFNDNMVILKES